MDKGRRDNSWMKRIIVMFVYQNVMEGVGIRLVEIGRRLRVK
jgi:hypothetical protein